MSSLASEPLRYAEVVLPVPLDQAFTYMLPPEMPAVVGTGVLAPWGPRRLQGVVVRILTELPPELRDRAIKPLAAVLDAEPLVDAPMLDLVRWAAAYYQAPIGEVMRCALPPGGSAVAPRRRLYRLIETAPSSGSKPAPTPAQIRILDLLRTRGGSAEASWLRRQVSVSALATLLRRGCLERVETEAPPTAPAWQPRPRVVLNSVQQRALAALDADGEPDLRPLLLHGVTGSGKTAVYIAAIQKVLERGESALLLVPEIGLTPALFADFEDAFPALVAVLHSGLSDAERAQHWRRLRAGAARVAIGTRSAVFAPLRRLGLIVVDEEHDASYKQQESPRYQGRDLAILRAKLCRARIVLGSATPSLESYSHAQTGKYRLVEMSTRVEHRPLPAVRVIDMAAEFRRQSAGRSAPSGTQGDARGGASEQIFSDALRTALAERLRLRQQSMLLINRRGFAPVVLCRSCGASVMCRDCAVALTFHKRADRLVCHYCGYATGVPRHCPACAGEHIYFLGAGSEKVEEALVSHFPEARIARLDRDTARTRRHFEQVLARFRDRQMDILIGTQMIAKGHDLPGVTLVGVLQADLGLTFPDFRAAERTFQLLTQVAGRAGRGRHPGEVLLQVMHPEHYAVAAAATADAAAFYGKESHFRRWMHYPPFAALACVQLRHRDYDQALHLATQAGEFLRTQAPYYPAVRVLGPTPALLARAKTEYRFQFLFKSASRRELAALLAALRGFVRERKFPATAVMVDVDPLNV